jgi:hypothetical protein
MAFEPNFFEDGDDADAAGLNSRFADAQAWVDDINRAGCRRGAFNHYHAWTPIAEGLAAVCTVSYDGIDHTYSRTTFLASVNYTTYGADGGADDVPSIGTGDRTLIGHPSATGAGNPPECVVTFSQPYKMPMSRGDRTAGILCLYNVQVLKVSRNDATDMHIMICIQYELNSSGVWYTVDESERILSHNDHVLDPVSTTEYLDFDIPIMTLLTAATVDEHGDHLVDGVSAVRAMVSLVDSNPASSVTLGQFTLTALPIHAEDP